MWQAQCIELVRGQSPDTPWPDFCAKTTTERTATISQLAAALSKPEAQAKELCVVLPSLAFQAWTLHVSGKPWANAQRLIYSQPRSVATASPPQFGNKTGV